MNSTREGSQLNRSIDPAPGPDERPSRPWSRKPRWQADLVDNAAGVAALVAVGVVVPTLVSSYWLFVFGQALFYLLATLGLFHLYGRTGQLSLAHAASMGVGAYVGAVVVIKGMDPVLSLPIAVLAAMAFGLLQAIPAMRLSGLRFAVVTLAFGFLFNWTIENTQDLTGGTQGLIVPGVTINGVSLIEPKHAFWVGLVLAYLATLLTIRLAGSRLGLRMVAVRDSEQAARSVGVDVGMTKVMSFVIASAYAGVAGWFMAFSSGFVSATSFNLFASSYLLVAVILGGAGSVTGAWLGAAYVAIVPRLFSSAGLSSSYPLLGGVLLIVIALLAPGGIVGIVQQVREWWQQRGRSDRVRGTVT